MPAAANKFAAAGILFAFRALPFINLYTFVVDKYVVNLLITFYIKLNKFCRKRMFFVYFVIKK